MFLPKEKVKAPRSLRTARLSVVKNQISTPVIQKNVSTPNKVIKALYDYNAQNPNELSFKRGDFFFIVKGDDQYYEAFNPITNSRGVVPVHYFQALEKHEKATNESKKSPTAADHTHQPQPNEERSDELDAKAGEAIIVIAQSNAEWYVAKPIGRLGGPGLIPVSFVDIRDASTGCTIPNNTTFQNVQDWKKKSMRYEASLEKQIQEMSITEEEDLYDDYFSSNNDSQESVVISAYVDSYILEADQYWFIVFAQLKNGKHRVLYRLYDDFYDFQINFLQEFPEEAGKKEKKRILPYMPGPLDTVNDEITEERAKDLSRYCADLLKLPKYLSESMWVQEQLFGIHEGDVETDTDPSQKPRPVHTEVESQTSTTVIKVKIVYKDEIFAIKVPVPSTLQFLQDKVVERLGFPVQLLYKKEGNQLTDLTSQTFEAAVKLEDELAPTQTTGYKPGEKKSLQEYQNLDAQDESLKKWKESLGLNNAAHATGPSDDTRRVVVEHIALEIEGREDVIVDLSTPGKVQHDVVSGLKYLQVVKRKGIRVDKTEEMIGSYGPAADSYEKKFQLEEAPSGMLARGHYEAKSKFIDDDNVTHMEWSWSFDIKKDW
ncbi:hypothetical protein G6F37_003174 [Rhizopus arrhizus]|nr:hypothetical protein G6F38_002823 [Rhizopus arrhizus]KAG1161337.1 hypothetical protein G6F37_003174 [Rhizopus arrhizus]